MFENNPEAIAEEVAKMQTENERRRASSSTFEHDAFPDTYIKARYLKGHGKATDMAGFEAGEPEPKLIVDPATGKKRLRVTLNGFVHIEKDGSCLILNTTFNRLKLYKLCKPQSLKMPKNSKGVTYTVVETKPDFAVEDESIFEGLDLDVDAAMLAKRDGKPVRNRTSKASSALVPVAVVDAQKAAKAAEADLDPERGVRARPEMSEPDGGLKLDLAEG